MKPRVNKTYIEKRAHYVYNRVAIVRKVTDKLVICTIINLDNWQRSPTRISHDEFSRRYELAPLQMQ